MHDRFPIKTCRQAIFLCYKKRSNVLYNSKSIMFRRGGIISRSLHAPRGVNIHGVDSSTKLKRKYSWSSPKVRSAASEGVLNRRPVVLKEGFLYKPGFFRFAGGRKRRWCVLNTYSQTEASIDIYLDETKTRYKGSISLDKENAPILIVKNYDTKKKSSKNCYLFLKIGKSSCQFTADSFREVKEWSAAIRQAMEHDTGHLFSGKVTEPLNICDGMINLKFNCNCIALICPITEEPIKTWRLDHITSFGQCGANAGILTFESCSTCSDPGASRCSISIIQEKPATILNLMERAIRSNVNTGEIHYERSILGDIYHCDHDCAQPQRLLPAYSDPNIFLRSTSTSPQKGFSVPIDVHDFDIPLSTGSNDSGLPGTPKQADALSINSNNVPTPYDNVQLQSHRSPGSSFQTRKVRSMSESGKLSPLDSEAMMQYVRRQSDCSNMATRTTSPKHSNIEPRKYSDGQIKSRQQLTYAAVKHNAGKKSSFDEEPVMYSMVHVSTSPEHDGPGRNKKAHSRLQPVDENDDIYDVPNCEPAYWEVGVDCPFSPPETPVNHHRVSDSSGHSSNSPNHTSMLIPPRKSSGQSSASSYTPGSDLREREEDFEELPPVPKHRRPRPAVKELVKINGDGPKRKVTPARPRLHSVGDVLDSKPNKHTSVHFPSRIQGSMDNLDRIGRNRSTSLANIFECGNSHLDLLSKLHEEDEMLNKVLAASRNERNDEVGGARSHPFYRLHQQQQRRRDDQEYDVPEEILEDFAASRRRMYSGTNGSSSDRLLTKVASDTVRGYAYKVQIPFKNSEYDVPRKAAPAPDLSHVRSDAPPKPLRR